MANTTPNLALVLPSHGDPDWDVKLNSNFGAIDSAISSINISLGNISVDWSQVTGKPAIALSGNNTDLTSLKLANGSAVAPSYSFASSTNSGFYWPNTSSIMTYSRGGTDHTHWTNGGIAIASGLSFGWKNSSSYNMDLVLVRDAANTLALRNGTNLQTFNLYGTYTDASNYERLSTTFDGGFNYVIDVQKAGTGSPRNFAIKTQGNWGLAVASGTGNITFYRHLGFTTDNTYDFGASGVNRPRSLYLGTSLYLGSTIENTSGNYMITATKFEGRSTFVFGWGSSDSYSGLDTCISRGGAATVCVGTGTSGDASGTLKAARLNLALTTPASSTATGTAGDMVFDANYIYICTAANTWKRVALTSF